PDAAKTRFFIDGHEVSSLLATGGEATMAWSYAGTVTFNDASWKVEGDWTLTLHAPAVASWNPTGRSSCVLSGEEHLRAGETHESLKVSGFTLNPVPRYCDPVGDVTNELFVPEGGVHQTVVHSYSPVRLSNKDIASSHFADPVGFTGSERSLVAKEM